MRLPVIDAYDGFLTSHQKRRIDRFDDPEEVKAIPLPLLTAAIRSEVTKKIQDAYAAVDTANQLEEKAVARLLRELHWQREGVREIA